MKILLNLYKDINFGSNKIDSITITTNTILVSFLKNLISQQYGIDKSILTLSVKTNNLHFVILADDRQLSFYNIKNNSNIYIKVEEDTKSNEFMIKKIKERENKSAFFKKLNIFQKGLNMDTIKESILEDLEIEEKPLNNDSNNSNIILNDKNELNDLSKIIENKFINSIINNDIDEFCDIMFSYKNVIDINKPIEESQNYSPIHYACMYGYSDMLKDILIKYKADINLISKDGWSPLHLCAFYGRMNILNILIKSKKLNFNLSLPNLGTALHCACKQNNLSIVSLLLYKCDPHIKNEKGELPIELTSNKYIKKLINKVTKDKNDKENENIKSLENMKHLSTFKFLKELDNIPVCPFRYVGYCSKRGKRFSKYNQRFIEINATKNLFLRYKFKEDYPIKTKEALFLTDIKSYKKTPLSKKDTYFYIELTVHDETQIYRFESLKVCNLWLEKMKESIEYSKFWKKVAKTNNEVYTYLNSFKPDVFEIDFLSGEIKNFNLTKDEKEKQKEKLNELISSQNIYVDKFNNKEKTLKGIKNNDSNSVEKNINLFIFEELIYENNLYAIYKVKYKLDGNNLIMKVFSTKNLIASNLFTPLETQINNLKLLKCPFIATINQNFQIDDKLYLTSDYYQTNLSFYKNKIIFEEDSIKLYIAEIILAIEYLHNKEFSYNNLNFEDILITKDNHIKLDALKINKTISYLEFSFDNGTRQGIGKSADIYAIGAILYELICGMPPLYIINTTSNNKNKVEELFLFDFFSDNLKDLLSKLLCKDPNIRIGIKNKKEIKTHPWFKNINWDDLLIKNVHPPLNFSLIEKEIEETINDL